MTKKRQVEAWHTVMATLAQRQRKVIQVILSKKGEATLREIADAMGCEQNNISGRLTELKKEKILIDDGSYKESRTSGRKMTLWKLNPDAPAMIRKKLNLEDPK